MNFDLPATGTAALLELLDPFVPDDFLNECWPRGRTGGRHRAHTAAQLYRVHLLSLLSPVHSMNLLVKMLPEQRAWRQFARVRRQNAGPDVRMLHEFRGRVGGARVTSDQRASARTVAGRLSLAALVSRADGCHRFARRLRGLQKKAPDNTPPHMPHWVDAPSRRGRVAVLSATRSTRSACGCTSIRLGCCWCRSSVGPRQPMFPRADCWCPACATVGNDGIGVRPWWWRTWAIWGRPPNSSAASNGA